MFISLKILSRKTAVLPCVLLSLGGCALIASSGKPAPVSGVSHRPNTTAAQPAPDRLQPIPTPTAPRRQATMSHQRQDVLMYTMGLLGIAYRFGGKNPEAGLDCSGMVSLIYREATGYPLTGNAVSMANEGRKVSLEQTLPGDLVFFNTRGFPYSHVGIFIGEGRFVHAPNSQGSIRVDRLDKGYFARRLNEARTYFD